MLLAHVDGREPDNKPLFERFGFDVEETPIGVVFAKGGDVSKPIKCVCDFPREIWCSLSRTGCMTQLASLKRTNSKHYSRSN